MNLLTKERTDFLRRLLAFTSADKAVSDNLCTSFGSFSSIFEAPPEKLMRVAGMTEERAALIALLPAIVRRALTERHPLPKRIDDPALADHLTARYFALSEEMLTVIFADKSGKILDLREYGDLHSDTVSTRISSIAETAVAIGANQLIWAHNHPGGFAIPSANDNAALSMILAACRDLGITVYDHIIIADDDYVSIKESVKERTNER
ncbi:MAG TPA: JAB domain-containing protein [Oscillospiraceae bacterium]|nr:JAB domain-containing protein [Oscillospiraceae bacterium]HPF55855.1 JAB domain-containing protein [Clostridiales bacterium]HPK34488.1 JAB domain-containing protein [Oscillospiraceae bacterium]HPR74716.1 JAB domain-containing protein [Oscillospiraceae bacterium]